jgi:hypothetical protein
MPRVLVLASERADRDDATVLFDELVHAVHLSSDHSAMQFIERLSWAISDAEDDELHQSRAIAPSRLPTPRSRVRAGQSHTQERAPRPVHA